jgi:class 3 adenylate cyclase
VRYEYVSRMGEGCVEPQRNAVVVSDRVEDRVARRRREQSVCKFALFITLKGASRPVCTNAHHLSGVIGFGQHCY